MSKTTELTTEVVVEAVAWERAPRYPGRLVNRRVVCADGFKVSVQASRNHYANDSGAPSGDDEWPPGNAPYWRGEESEVNYPYVTFEIGAPTEADLSSLEEWHAEGVWAWVPRAAVAALLEAHGGAVEWEQSA